MGTIAVLLLWAGLCLAGIVYPWMGFGGYVFFAILCPQWNWRWSIPDVDFQKFLAASTLLGVLLSGLKRNALNVAERSAVLCLWAYLALAYVSSFQTISPLKTSLYLDTSWKMVLMMTVGIFVVRESKQLIWLTAALIVAQGWNAFNINQLFYSRGWINLNYFSWNYLDNNTYSISSVPIMALSLAAMLSWEKTWVRAASGIVFVLQMHQLMILESRGTMLGAILLCGLAVWFMRKSTFNNGTVLAAVLIGAVLAGPPVVKEFSSAFASEENRDSSADSRFKVWKAGAGIMQDYPLLGVGPWAGERMVPYYYEGYGEARDHKALHNLFFEVGTGIGIPGLVCYLAFFWLTWWYHFRMRKEADEESEWFRCINLAILCGIPGYWAASMFSSGALIEAPYALTALGLMSLVVLRNEQDEWEEEFESDLDEMDEEFVDSSQEPAAVV